MLLYILPTNQKEVVMQSRRFHRLSRFRKNKRLLRERLRQRIFFQRQVVPEMMESKEYWSLQVREFLQVAFVRFARRMALWEEASG